MMIKQSFTELNARERATILLDQGSYRELLGPFSHLKSPHLLKQSIIPQNDDGMIIMKGLFQGQEALVIAMEGKFQGGGIGEISGSKFAAALEKVLEENKKGHQVLPLIIMDSGGVRLQEANYGLLTISEIQDLLTEIRSYVPVIGLVPGKVGCFGGMSMTCALFSYIIMTKEGRLSLNGPEVIEQEAGKQEWNSSDKVFTYRVIGGAHRVEQGFADILIDDDIMNVKQAIHECIQKGIPEHRSMQIDRYRKIVDANAPKLFKHNQTTNKYTSSRGRIWFEALAGKNFPQKGNISSVLCTDIQLNTHNCRMLAVVPDNHTAYPRTLHGELGLQQGWEIARLVREGIKADKNKTNKRAFLSIVDVPSQAYGYWEEYYGIFLSCAAAVNAYADARHQGHPVITLIVGNAISGAFLAHGLQGSYILSLDDETITVHAMSKKSASRITKRSVDDMEHAAQNVPAIAYDIHSFYCLGSVNKLMKFEDHDHPQEPDIQTVKENIEEGICFSIEHHNSLNYRLSTPNAAIYRCLSKEIRTRMKEEWEQ